MDKIVLRHTHRQGDWVMYFYDGELPVKDSVLEIPASRPEWAKRAWTFGFRMTVDGRVIADLTKHIRAQTADVQDAPCEHEEVMVNDDEVVCCARCGEPQPDLTPADLDNDVEPENAESDEETDTDEGAAAGRQPVEDDGVRTREPRRRGSVPEEGMAGSGGDEPADGGDGDESAD